MSSSSERGEDDDFLEDEEDAVSVEMGEAPQVAKKARRKRYTLNESCRNMSGRQHTFRHALEMGARLTVVD